MDELYVPICSKVFHKKQLAQWTETQLKMAASLQNVNIETQNYYIKYLFGNVFDGQENVNKEEELKTMLEDYVNNMVVRVSSNANRKAEFNINV